MSEQEPEAVGEDREHADRARMIRDAARRVLDDAEIERMEREMETDQ